MKKVWITIGIILAGFFGWFFTEKPKPPFGAVVDPIVSEINVIFDLIQTYENLEMVNNGNYVQLLSDKTIIKDGITKTVWNKSIKPADTVKGWNNVPGLPATTNVSYWVDIYEAGVGKGYTIYAEYQKPEGVYKYFRHIGKETYRDAGEDVLITPPAKPPVIATLSYGI